MFLLLLWDHAGREEAARVLNRASPDSTLLSFVCISLPACISNIFSHVFVCDWLCKIKFCARESMFTQYSFFISFFLKISASNLLCNNLSCIQHSEKKNHQ